MSFVLQLDQWLSLWEDGGVVRELIITYAFDLQVHSVLVPLLNIVEDLAKPNDGGPQIDRHFSLFPLTFGLLELDSYEVSIAKRIFRIVELKALGVGTDGAELFVLL